MPKSVKRIAKPPGDRQKAWPLVSGITVLVILCLGSALWIWKSRSREEARMPWLEGISDTSGQPSPGAAYLERIKGGTNRLASLPDGESGGVLLKPDEQVVREFKEGARLLEAGQLSEAIENYQAILKITPQSEDAYFNLGIAYARQGRLDEAEKNYREAIRIMPQYAEAHNNLGNVLASQGRLDDAIEQFEAALKILPDHATAHNNLGSVLARQGRVPEAAAHFAQAARSMPEYVEAHYNYGIACQTMGRIQEAEAAFQAALKIKPNFLPARQALARLGQTSQP